MKKRVMEKIVRNYEKVSFAIHINNKVPKIPFHSDEEVYHIKNCLYRRMIKRS